MGPAGATRDDVLVTVPPPELPVRAGSGGALSLTLFSASGDRMVELSIPPQRTATVALSFESSDTAAVAPPHQVTFSRRGNRLFVSDAAPESGLYLKLDRNGSWLLDVADSIRIGEQTFVFIASSDAGEAEASPFLGLLEIAAEDGGEGRTHVIPASGVVLGRDSGDLTFPDDRFVSSRHCSIHRDEHGLVYLSDLGSTNGTFVHLSEEHPLKTGDVLRAGPIFVRVDFEAWGERP